MLGYAEDRSEKLILNELKTSNFLCSSAKYTYSSNKCTGTVVNKNNEAYAVIIEIYNPQLQCLKLIQFNIYYKKLE